MAQGQFTCPEQVKRSGSPGDAEHRLGNGGKPDSAMGGGSDVSKLDEALASVESFVSEKL